MFLAIITLHPEELMLYSHLLQEDNKKQAAQNNPLK
jgi:hypothetical protein